jgi:hypothetical protein
MDTQLQLSFTDEEYIGVPDKELAAETAPSTLEAIQAVEMDPADFDLANSWFLS